MGCLKFPRGLTFFRWSVGVLQSCGFVTLEALGIGIQNEVDRVWCFSFGLKMMFKTGAHAQALIHTERPEADPLAVGKNPSLV